MIGQKAELLNNTWQDQTVWDGTSFSKRTPEVYGGVPTTIVAAFRVFPNYAYSILDYEMFITHAKLTATQYKYRDVIGMTDPDKMISEISKRGYATGTTYRTSVMRIINQYDLTKYDKAAISALQNNSEATIPTTPTSSSTTTSATTATTSSVPSGSNTSGAKTVYRVQVGVFKISGKRSQMAASIKNKLKLDCFA